MVAFSSLFFLSFCALFLLFFELFLSFFLLGGGIPQIRGASKLDEDGLTGEVCALRRSRDVSADVGRYKGEGVSSVPSKRGQGCRKSVTPKPEYRVWGLALYSGISGGAVVPGIVESIRQDSGRESDTGGRRYAPDKRP